MTDDQKPNDPPVFAATMHVKAGTAFNQGATETPVPPPTHEGTMNITMSRDTVAEPLYRALRDELCGTGMFAEESAQALIAFHFTGFSLADIQSLSFAFRFAALDLIKKQGW